MAVQCHFLAVISDLIFWCFTTIAQKVHIGIVLSIGPVKQNIQHKIAIIFLSISLNMCFGCSKEPSLRDGSFEYPQHMIWLRNKKIIFSYALLSGGLLIRSILDAGTVWRS